jgi:ABC-type phosphate transport system substrate-binding protein
VRLGILAATCAAVLAIGGAAAADALAATECGTGAPANIQGQGSSLQRVAQQEWTGREVPAALGASLAHTKLTPERGYAKACPSGTTVSYTSTSSGEGLTAFRYRGEGAILNGGTEPESGYAFVGTDDAPTKAQIENAESATSSANGLIIPVAETSIAVVIHPPAGCIFKAGKTHGISFELLNKVFAGTLKEWSGFGSQVEGTCGGAITRVVRTEGSGTTYQFKNYLSVLETTQSSAGPGCSLGTWASLEQLGAEDKPNITWPECAGTSTVVRKVGGGELAEYVKGTAGTIGYAVLPDAKSKGAEVARLQNSKPAEYALPETGTASNCGERVYTIPTERVSGDGEGEGVVWSGVFGASPTVGGALYPLCTLTYDLAWSGYRGAGYGKNETEAKNIALAVKKYIGSYVLGAGQSLLGEHFYQALPTTVGHNVLAAAELAASKINGGGGSPAKPTSLTTSLSGEGESGASITVLEGASVKDQATLAGENAAKATGKVSYAVYADTTCKELVTKAGEFEVKEGKVPASEEKTLEGGKTYYWQADYSGDSFNAESTSACGSEVLAVKATTSLSTNLVGGNPESEEAALEGSEVVLTEGFPAHDSATLSGVNSSTATGAIHFKIYSDGKCETLVAGAGEAALGESLTVSSEDVELGEGTYYWQAEYEGDSLHQPSKSPCGSEVLKVEAETNIATALKGGAVIESGESGEVVEVEEGEAVGDSATLEGANVASATGTVEYDVYRDPECSELATSAGKVTVSGGEVPGSETVVLEPGTYFFQARYSGSANNSASVSECGTEIVAVKQAGAPPKEMLHEEAAKGGVGNALVVGTKVEGTSGAVEFVFENGKKIECTAGQFLGKVTRNNAKLGVVEVTSWEIKNGGVKPGRCRTTLFLGGEALEVLITVKKPGLKPSELRMVPAGPLGAVGGGTVGPFEIRIEIFSKKIEVPLVTCEFGRPAVPVKFAFNVPLGLEVVAKNPQRLNLTAAAPAIPNECGNRLSMMGTYAVNVAGGGKPVIPI